MSERSDATMKGAASGAAMGAPLGPWGAGAGALAGGAYGYFSSGSSSAPKTQIPQSDYIQRLYLTNAIGSSAPTQDTAQSDQWRAQQMQLAGMLNAQANGTRPGAGEMAVNRQIGQANAQQTAQASMARGANAALAMRNAARMQANIGVNGAGQAAIAQMNDQTAARQQLGSLLGGARGQDLQIAGANQQAQTAEGNLQLGQLQQLLAVDQARLGQSNRQEDLALAAQQRSQAQTAAMAQAAGTALASYGGGDPNKKKEGTA